MQILFGRYYQDEKECEPIEWIPFRRTIQWDNKIKYSLISKKILLLWSYVENWYEPTYYNEPSCSEYLNDTFLNKSFSKEEQEKLIPYSDKWKVTLPYYEEIFDASGSRIFTANNVMETEPTRWSANGNQFELNPNRNRNWTYTMEFAYKPTWQVLVQKHKAVIIQYQNNKPELNTYIRTGASYGIRPCIYLYSDTIPELNMYSEFLPTGYEDKSKEISAPVQQKTKLVFAHNNEQTSVRKQEQKSIFGPPLPDRK